MYILKRHGENRGNAGQWESAKSWQLGQQSVSTEECKYNMCSYVNIAQELDDVCFKFLFQSDHHSSRDILINFNIFESKLCAFTRVESSRILFWSIQSIIISGLKKWPNFALQRNRKYLDNNVKKLSKGV